LKKWRGRRYQGNKTKPAHRLVLCFYRGIPDNIIVLFAFRLNFSACGIRLKQVWLNKNRKRLKDLKKRL
jgi:hypothetical protein